MIQGLPYKNVLIFGGAGQLGRAFQRQLRASVSVAACDSLAVDAEDCKIDHVFNMTEHKQLAELISQIKPDLILNCAAYNLVEQAEVEEPLAKIVNGTTPGVMAGEAKKVGAWFVHYSTDYVFDGKKGAGYVETDAAEPLNAYGRSKYLGEQLVRKATSDALVIRTSRVFSEHGKNAVKIFLDRAQQSEILQYVSDQLSGCVSATSLANMTLQVLQRPRAELASNAGLLHMISDGCVSWFDMAEAILSELKKRDYAMVATQVEAVSESKFPSKIKRPKNSCLDTGRLKTVFGVKPPSWRSEISSVVDALLA